MKKFLFAMLIVFNQPVFSQTDTNGKVKSVTVKMADFVKYNRYEFTKK